MSLADPIALQDSVLAAVDAGIPVITINSGSDVYKEFGAITHVGQDEFDRRAGCRREVRRGRWHQLLCVMQEQANVGLEARCDGADDTFGGERHPITTSGDADPTTSQQEITAALDADRLDRRHLRHRPGGRRARTQRRRRAGREVMIGSVDLSTDLLDAIEAGEIAFTIDQQQYLQGYLPVVMLYLNITNENTTGGGLPVYTGPGFVDSDQRRRRSRIWWRRAPAEHQLVNDRRRGRHGGDRAARAGDTRRSPRPELVLTTFVAHSRSRGDHELMTPRPRPRPSRRATSGIAYRGPIQRLLLSPEIGALIGAVVVWTFFWGDGDTFGNVSTLASTGSTSPRRSGIMAVAVALLMIGGEFDLSAGVMTGATGILVALMARSLHGRRSEPVARDPRRVPRGRVHRMAERHARQPNRTAELHRDPRHVLRAPGANLVFSKRLADKVTVDDVDDARMATSSSGRCSRRSSSRETFGAARPDLPRSCASPVRR